MVKWAVWSSPGVVDLLYLPNRMVRVEGWMNLWV